MTPRPGEDSLEGLAPEDRARLQSLLARGWSLPGEHPLARLHGVELGDYRLLLLLGPKNNVGSRYFQLFLADADGRLGEGSLALGLYNSGPFPAYNWVELTQYRPVQRFDGRVLDFAGEGLDSTLFEMISGLVPPGGHIMVEYDSPGQKATERVLTRGFPPATSPLAFSMFRVGCRSYRDWYISEGGREGPRKLQCFKPLNEDIRREKEEQMREELNGFLARSENSVPDEWTELARRTARALLAELGSSHTNP